jgi:hypothetical protein
VSTTPMLNILGCYLVQDPAADLRDLFDTDCVVGCVGLQAWAVLFDTFIVRSVLVPAAMHLLGDASWWPKKFGPPTKSA